MVKSQFKFIFESFFVYYTGKVKLMKQDKKDISLFLFICEIYFEFNIGHIYVYYLF